MDFYPWDTVKAGQAYPTKIPSMKFIIQKLNPLVLVDFRFISAFFACVISREFTREAVRKFQPTQFPSNLTQMSSKKFHPLKDFQSVQVQRSSHNVFTAHYVCRNAKLNLTLVTGTTINGLIFQIINIFINRILGVYLTCFDCNIFSIFYRRLIVEARLCSKENFREPFRLQSILVKAPRPQSWSPK